MPDRISPSVRRALARYEERLRARFGGRVHPLRLFGSFARAEADDASDIDVLVLIDDLKDDERAIASSEIAGIVVATGLALSPLIMANAHFLQLCASGRPLARAILQEGREP